MKRYIYIVLGVLSLTIGIIGITVPGLPTTPFILLSAWLFSRSSEFLLRKMMSIKIVSTYVTNYQKKKGMSVTKKIITILFMWGMVSLSVIFHIDSITFKHIIVGNAVIGTLVMGFVVPTAKQFKKNIMNKESAFESVVIGNYNSITDAEIARGILESAKIECFISNKALSNIYGLSISMNVELTVRKEDAKFAEELLNADFVK